MPTIKILQTHFQDNHKDTLEYAFTPFNARTNPLPHLREFPLYYDLFKSGKHKENDYTGIFSYKYKSKAKISGEKFISFVRNNPGYDAYFINPYPQLAYLSYNIWEQGEYFHPGIKKLTNQLFSMANCNFDTSTHGRDTKKNLLYANFWIGNEHFWERYISFLLKIHEATAVSISTNPNPYLEETPHITPAPMYPFIFERLFTTFIKNESSLSYLSYPHSQQEIVECCNTPAELAIYNNIHGLVDRWDSENTYNSERKTIFTALLASSAEYEKLIMRIGEHPFS